MKTYLGILTLSLLLTAIKTEDLGDVVLKPKFEERFVKTGDRLNVKCSVLTKDGSGDLKWEKPVDTGVTFQIGQERESGNVRKYSEMTIAKMDRSLLGRYSCSYGTSSQQFILSEAQEIKTKANFSYEEKNEPVTLSCKLSLGDDKTIEKVEWLKNDTLVSELTEHNRFKVDEENNTLTITGTDRDDADQYYARYTIKDMDQPYDCGVMFAAAPLVLDFDKSKNLIEGDNMELQCKVKGFPRADVQWLKNGELLNATDNKRITQSPLFGYKNARLVIKDVQFSDAGDYKCYAYSSYFNESDSKSLVVRVKDKLAALWPFLGIVGEVIILCTIIFIYEKRRNKQAESEANNAEDVDGSTTDKKEGLRHRNTQSNNPTA